MGTRGQTERGKNRVPVSGKRKLNWGKMIEQWNKEERSPLPRPEFKVILKRKVIEIALKRPLSEFPLCTEPCDSPSCYLPTEPSSLSDLLIDSQSTNSKRKSSLDDYPLHCKLCPTRLAPARIATPQTRRVHSGGQLRYKAGYGRSPQPSDRLSHLLLSARRYSNSAVKRTIDRNSFLVVGNGARSGRNGEYRANSEGKLVLRPMSTRLPGRRKLKAMREAAGWGN